MKTNQRTKRALAKRAPTVTRDDARKNPVAVLVWGFFVDHLDPARKGDTAAPVLEALKTILEGLRQPTRYVGPGPARRRPPK